MSANVYWRPQSVTKQAIRTGTPSRFITAMTRAFGDGIYWKLHVSNLDVVRGMEAAWDADLSSLPAINPFSEIIAALTANPDGIEVWAEY